MVLEEAAARGKVPSAGNCFWLVDPLDGTKEFVSRNGEFTVNIALVENGEPTLAIVLAPEAPCGTQSLRIARNRTVTASRASLDNLVKLRSINDEADYSCSRPNRPAAKRSRLCRWCCRACGPSLPFQNGECDSESATAYFTVEQTVRSDGRKWCMDMS